MNIQDFSDEDFLIEARRRVDEGRYSPDEYMSRHQDDDRAKLDHIRSAIFRHWTKWPRVADDLKRTMDRLDSIHGNPLDRSKVAAINTTFYGKDDVYIDHSPKPDLTKADETA